MATRRPLVLGLTALLAVGLSACAKSTSDVQNAQSTGTAGGAGGQSGQSVTVLVSADTNIQDLWTKQLVPGFTKANPGIKVNINFDLHGEHDAQNAAKLAAAVKGGKDVGFDVIDAGFVTQAAGANLLLKEDATTLPALAQVNKTLVEAGKGYGVPYRASSVLLAYNTTKVKTPPKTLDELLAWIKANPGRFAYNSPKSGGSGQSFVTTVLDANMDQAASDKLRTTYDKAAMAGWDKGFAVLKGLNPYVYGKGVYPNGNSQVLQLLSSGQIDMAPVWSDMFVTAKTNGQIPASVSSAQISNPSFTGGASYLGVPATTTHKDAAQKLLEYVLTPDAQAAIATQIAGTPVLPLASLPADVQKKFEQTAPETMRPTYVSEVSNDLNNQWDQKVPGQ
ncbi:extracellular solute-binding protein [Arsenicicoccus piscis]|uniref:ABC transporter substrate-binding protein n=1 Tax=Arsenicicoccus piscis TaxID=673954 RepID=A0ABQ6HKW4_9MICO|nr:extracellular solute-binding protein [Arsenicicoccus piscis]MCH8626971.1 extracellular solute-binding protein [Arsenicicoccus piscis]GMA19106.1 ABC transporter substrate-binding protein [Arsenicicoccus piscis]